MTDGERLCERLCDFSCSLQCLRTLPGTTTLSGRLPDIFKSFDILLLWRCDCPAEALCTLKQLWKGVCISGWRVSLCEIVDQDLVRRLCASLYTGQTRIFATVVVTSGCYTSHFSSIKPFDAEFPMLMWATDQAAQQEVYMAAFRCGEFVCTGTSSSGRSLPSPRDFW